MSVIRRLDEAVINRIAAGEVVQRPSAAIKEMIENSLDAGATSITITAKGGGLQLLQIQDNGHGIRKEDLEIVCERFTTSKLATFEDLKSIATFGFRGEALASITHVSHVTLLTKTKSSPCAYKAKYSDGRLVPLKAGDKAEPKPCAGVIGTTITVEDLFYNMQTRKQAFKNVNEEYQRILDVVTKYSIRYGDGGVSFTCKKFGMSVPDLHTPSTSASSGGTLENIRIAYGSSLAKELINFEFSHVYDASSGSTEGLNVTVSGKISNANYSHKKAIYIFFINNRLVDCTAIKKTIETVYADILPRHSFPFVYLSIRMPPEDLDVNVHPTKKEVHFLHEEELLEVLHARLSAALRSSNDSRSFQVQTTLRFDNLNSPPPLPVAAPQSMSSVAQAVSSADAARTNSSSFTNAVSLDATNYDHRTDFEHQEEEDDKEARRTKRGAEAGEDEFEGESEEEEEEGEEAEFDFSQVHTRNYPDNASSSSRRQESYARETHNRAEEVPETEYVVAMEPFVQQPSRSSGSTGRSSSGGGSGGGGGSVAPKKLVRTDPSLVKINTFFKPTATTALQTQTTGGADGAVDSTSCLCATPVFNPDAEFCAEVGTAERSVGSKSASSSQPGAFAASCMCCGKNAKRRRVQQPPPSVVPANGDRLPELVETSCQYSSVQALISEIKGARNAEIDAVLKNYTFVGVVDCHYSLAQHGTRLLLVDHAHLLRDLHYQLVIRRFAELDMYQLSAPVDIETYLIAALVEEVESGRLDPGVREGGVERLAAAAVALLVSKAPLLEEYFNIRIDPESRALTGLPVLVHGVSPLPEELPTFLLSLATSTNWEDEMDCFRTVALALAAYYSHLPAEYPASKALGAEAFPALTKGGADLLQSVLYPALRLYLVPHRQRSQDHTVVQVAALEQLYKVFERC